MADFFVCFVVGDCSFFDPVMNRFAREVRPSLLISAEKGEEQTG